MNYTKILKYQKENIYIKIMEDKNMGKIYNEMFEIKKQCDEKMTQLMEEMMAQFQTIDTTKAYNEFNLYCNNLISNESIIHDQIDNFELG